jgi:hypothetical protein
MPLKRRILKTRKQDVTPHILSYLLCEDHVEELRKDNAWDYWVLDFPTCSREAKQIWAAAKEFVIPEWIKRHPGTRPPYWWTFDAPRVPKGRWPGVFFDGTFAERLRVGGIGKPEWEEKFPALVPHYELGIPSYWDIESIDVDDPPRFESQASYLRRHTLMTDAERRRVKRSDYDPETLNLQCVHPRGTRKGAKQR